MRPATIRKSSQSDAHVGGLDLGEGAADLLEDGLAVGVLDKDVLEVDDDLLGLGYVLLLHLR